MNLEPNSSSKEKLRSGTKGLWWLIVVAALAAVADQLTKVWASDNLESGSAVSLPGGFISLQLYHNPGAAFSFAEGGTVFITIVSLAICVGVVWYGATGKIRSIPLAVILGFILGGAVGNLIDRMIQPPGFARGHVVDFLAYGNWFVGNVADIWIVGGVIALLIYLVFQEYSQKEDPRQEDPGKKDARQEDSRKEGLNNG